MQTYYRDWRIYNRQLVNRSRVITILIDPMLMESDSLQELNKGKLGRRFRFYTGLISAAFAVKCVFRLAYRQLEGFMKDIADKVHKSIPNFRTIWWRIDKMKNEGIKFNVNERHTVVAIDSTGLRSVNTGEYRTTKFDIRREWTKLHIVVDIKTKEILNIKITKGNVNDCLEFESLLKPVSEGVMEVFADKAYCSTKIYEFCDEKGIFPGIPVKWNFSNRIPSRIRRRMLEEQLGLVCRRGSMRLNRHLTKEVRQKNQEEWKKRVGYGRRSAVESSFSRYKRILGENIFSRKRENI